MSSQQIEARRRKAIALVRQGKPFRWIAQTLGASLSSVVRWCQTYRKHGSKELKSRSSPGRPSLLSSRQKEDLKRQLLKGAVAAGYSTELWTLKRIRKLIRTHYEINYTQIGVWWLLIHGLGWSYQKPERRAIQRDEDSIAHWKKSVWPRIKKRPRTWRPSGFSQRKRLHAYPKPA
jgi:transposase